MKSVVQRVAEARVRVDGEVVGEIGRGALLLLGVEEGGTTAEAEATARKIAKMRMFPGSTPMDETLLDVGGACLVISQFTLAANLRKGNRTPDEAEMPLRQPPVRPRWLSPKIFQLGDHELPESWLDFLH